MKLIACLICLSLVWATAQAKDEVTRSFTDSTGNTDVALENVEQKALIAEFIDRQDTGIGRDLAQLLWLEAHAAVSDQAGAGVVLAKTPKGKHLVSLLKNDYHNAAVAIAEQQSARMALWGAAFENDGKVLVNSYLSLISAMESNVINYRNSRTNDKAEIELKLSRTSFNFALETRSRKQLFARAVIVESKSNLRSSPSIKSEVLDQISSETLVQALNIQGKWFEVRVDGKQGYVIGSHIRVIPPSIMVDKPSINLRSKPSTLSDKTFANARVQGQFTVIDQRDSKNSKLWYQISFKDKPVWIREDLADPVYSLPVVHFMAGLHRYFGKRYDDAFKEFQRFIDYPNTNQSNVNLSVAYQYQALCKLFSENAGRGSDELLRMSMKLTPYDATPYQIRALTLIGTSNSKLSIKAALEQAQMLDPRLEPFKGFE